jgi:D-alanyl-D-alanine carboxypeptidase/D-alanyl-D-alanine-endopeptidase (penicillin-binding protein 4)
LQADFSDPTHIRFAGSYPLACGEKTWLQAYADPAHYNQRVILGLWQAMGGRLQGQVRLGRLPQALQGQAPIWELASPPLAEVIRDINKFSNNVMAQQLFLTLGLQAAKRLAPDARTLPPGTPEAARTELYRWWSARLGSDEAPLFENGSGLSRQSRISAQALAHLLQLAYRSPYMAEFMASLPVAGVDGTMQKRPLPSGASAHLKTGSLRDVSALAGYVLANSQRRYVVVAMVNHANAKAARPAFDAFLDWVAQDAHVALKSIPSPPKTKRTRQGLAKPSQHKISRSSF